MSFSIPEFVFLVPLGVITGILSGMLGIGGGSIVVPALIFGLPLFGVAGPDVPKIAMATSLALIIPTSIASAEAHADRGAIDWLMAAILTPSISAGAFLTGAFAAALNVHFVTVIFIAFTLFTAWGLASGRRTPSGGLQASPCFPCMMLKGVGGGALAALMGFGGAFFAVPLLARMLPMPRAIATAGALALPVALAGTAGYLIADAPAGCASCTGYVFLPAVAALGISAVLSAPIGVRAAHGLPVAVLRCLFAAFLVFAAGSLAYKTLAPAVLIGEANRLAALAVQLADQGTVSPIAAKMPVWMQEHADITAHGHAAQREDRR